MHGLNVLLCVPYLNNLSRCLRTQHQFKTSCNLCLIWVVGGEATSSECPHSQRKQGERKQKKDCRWKTSEEVTECEDREATHSWHRPNEFILWGHKSVSVMWVRIHNLCLLWNSSKCSQCWNTIKVDCGAGEHTHRSGPGKHFAFNSLEFFV